MSFTHISSNYKNISKSSTIFKHYNPTVKLLMSSVLVAFSGASRVYVASLLLQTSPGLLICIAGGLIIYSVYTLDRALGSEEDILNRKELSGSRKEIGLAASLLTFLIGSYVFLQEDILALAFLPFVTGFLYSKGIKIGRFALKLKGGLGVKNFVTGLTWGLSVAGVAGSTCKNILPIVLVFIFFGVKLFVNSTIYDFQDVKGDIHAGIKTLPVCLGELKTRVFLIGIHTFSHVMVGLSILKGVLAFEPLIVLYSFISGLICIRNYTKSDEEEYYSRKLERTILADGESTAEIILREFLRIVLV